MKFASPRAITIATQTLPTSEQLLRSDFDLEHGSLPDLSSISDPATAIFDSSALLAWACGHRRRALRRVAFNNFCACLRRARLHRRAAKLSDKHIFGGPLRESQGPHVLLMRVMYAHKIQVKEIAEMKAQLAAAQATVIDLEVLKAKTDLLSTVHSLLGKSHR